MALQTPRRLPAMRPSLGTSQLNTASSPNLALATSTAIARKASLNALTGITSPPDMAVGQELEVGDQVDVPGGMHGTVKFIGSVRGKRGVFAGVELSREFAARGKNDGDVDGTHYFTTSVPGAGIFLPVHRASKRGSGPYSTTDNSPTPNFANSTIGLSHDQPSTRYSPPTPSTLKFSQSVGPGARAPSPTFKAKSRPSLPRPESPLRKQPNLMATPGKASVGPAGFSKSQIGTPRFAASPAPGKAGIAKPRTPGPSRPYSRNNSRLGHNDVIDEDSELTPTGRSRTSDASASSITPRGKTTSYGDDAQTLTKKLEERDKQLKEQAASLAEMEASLTELQNLMANNPDSIRAATVGPEDADVAHLRSLLREKNEKIAMLTAEFDAHRADFRSTIDTLELASTETVRVYEKKVNDLMQELNEMHERGEDVDSVARQLKQLEELVQELEEGLEDARRGEAEARGEVEFLRGEVERGRSELRREREKAAAAIKGAGAAMDGPREVAQRDDEIRGLKAIIHSLSSGSELPGSSPGMKNGTMNNSDAGELERLRQRIETLEREKGELRGLVERKAYREEELEREVERLRQQPSSDIQRSSVASNGLSESTAVQDKRSSGRDSKGTITSWRSSPQQQRHSQRHSRRHSQKPLEPMIESDAQSSADGSVLWCEICETGGHDILNCTAMGSSDTAPKPNDASPVVKHHDSPLRGQILSPTHAKTMSSPGNAPTAPLPNPYDSSLVPGKGSKDADPAKWCALCERDGHDATACPFEDAF